MTEKKTGAVAARVGLIIAMLLAALPGYVFLMLLTMGMAPCWQRVIPVTAGMGWL